jgi:hypothetical protein
MKINKVYIKDDYGFLWFYNPKTGNIQVEGDDSLPKSQRGYACQGFQDGIKLLKQYKYLSNPQELT